MQGLCGSSRAVCAVVLLAVLGSAAASLRATAEQSGARPVLVIPWVERPPELEDFLEMKPNDEWEGRLAKVGSFIQRQPSDGAPSSQHTEAYLGYDDKNLYAVFVCFDSEPGKIRARMTRREGFFEDDYVGLFLDTFYDQRRAYAFITNPFGIQGDGLWTEGRGSTDMSFDTLWHSRGKPTDQGYVAWMAIPFKSLRFPAIPQQTWGIALYRRIPRVNEEAFWPHVSSRIEGLLNQAATLRGLEKVSPGRNVQLIPYGMFRSFRALDTRDPEQPTFVRDRADPDAGLDAKFVFKDSLVLDVALNPDFSQVESDEPQVTVNQRFEVYFPEKRPFFLENAGFFGTPINLLFTRRIADPQFGVRLTGKVGPYAIGAFVADDEAPGKRVLPDDPLHGKRALFGIVRVSRDIFQQSTLGFIYTDREFEDSYNRVGGLDGRFKLSQNWVARFQGVTSASRFLDGSRLAGPAYDVGLSRSGRQLFYNLHYNDYSSGFRTEPGFLRRPDIRSISQFVQYRFRPEGKYLISWGPESYIDRVWDHSGTRLDWTHQTQLSWEFTGQTWFGFSYSFSRERLRPQDFPVLAENRDFSGHSNGFFFSSSYIPQVNFQGWYGWATGINYVPPYGQEPTLANWSQGEFGLTLRPTTPLLIDNTYLLTRFTDRASGGSIFNNHILRSKWNWQFTRELSLRVILQYDSVLANPALTALETSKNFNADFLITYLVNPWTALYIGYNGNAQNIDLLPTATGSEIIRHRRRFINDAKQFFIKFSYVFRF